MELVNIPICIAMLYYYGKDKEEYREQYFLDAQEMGVDEMNWIDITGESLLTGIP